VRRSATGALFHHPVGASSCSVARLPAERSAEPIAAVISAVRSLYQCGSSDDWRRGHTGHLSRPLESSIHVATRGSVRQLVASLVECICNERVRSILRRRAVNYPFLTYGDSHGRESARSERAPKRSSCCRQYRCRSHIRVCDARRLDNGTVHSNRRHDWRASGRTNKPKGLSESSTSRRRSRRHCRNNRAAAKMTQIAR
jgi:hypothetical protein